ncbi:MULTISPECIES: YhcN/YlaJ family sporulation lipoprotein [Bacillus]|uniref:YhcN/YlaJ family sporulation lipoprotein n=1 Tax=Bacillus TaxID=1386 RepID=UPI000771B82F|nr:YhcN/YlaJ family sporulation lipoprotein [Bacillus safensis]MCM2985851.1 YhcN/YlaJ family sporulation lipoprotein [Bacillus safensis]MCY1096477.1 YhcN/YlaJ family sporulation lipoprotein [Bacillus safensis]MCY7446429.1 YhcN/YlaJ family sporulation lipoprotein [Bacillus safensis]MCY7457171.1 YhcN/YlaJ family sporulation lipoprotein [Bacillus safensis]MCY7473856.1 YhcN/YlaJ family sporulation lipoprotein [Bacillus safensis]
MNKKWMLSLLLVPTLITAGCGMNNQGDERRGTMKRQYENVTYKNDNMRQDQPDVQTPQKVKVADKASELVANMSEVKTANVFVTGKNAFVAVVLEGNKSGDVTDDLKKKISDKVKSTDQQIDNVYVSANPDFVDRMQGYGKRIKSGEPISGFFDEFTETVRRVFPESK